MSAPRPSSTSNGGIALENGKDSDYRRSAAYQRRRPGALPVAHPFLDLQGERSSLNRPLRKGHLETIWAQRPDHLGITPNEPHRRDDAIEQACARCQAGQRERAHLWEGP